jgi:hypothetical protein
LRHQYQYHPDGTVPNLDFIWVFGSNLAGRHGAGAALVATTRFGAPLGKGVGPIGQSYAIPTKDRNLRRLSLAEIKQHVDNFLTYADAKPKLKFWVTRVGCGLAGFSNEQVAPLFKSAPTNCNFAQEWRPWL